MTEALPHLEEDEAVFVLSLLMARADGHLHNAELKRITQTFEQLASARGIAHQGAEALVRRATARVSSHAPEVLIAAAEACLPAARRKEVFFLAVAIATADGHLADAERDMALRIGKMAGVSGAEITRIFASEQRWNQGQGWPGVP